MPDQSDPIEEISCEELDRRCQETITDIQADMDAYDERTAMLVESWDDGKSTSQRAIEALGRPERFKGEHDVARAWLRGDPEARIFRKMKDA